MDLRNLTLEEVAAAGGITPLTQPPLVADALLQVAQDLLDKLAAKNDAQYASLTRYTHAGDGGVFYGVDFHKDRIVRSGHGGTLADALLAAEKAEPFDTRAADSAEAA